MTQRRLHVGSTFSGVGGADIGLERAGFDIAWTCEYDAWKRSILQAHWPDIPHYTDVRLLCRDDHGAVRDVDADEAVGRESSGRWAGNADHRLDVLVGGFPCQDLSVAGKRRGFDGERSVLAFEFLRIAESLRPRWLLLENVPGLLSSNGGRDMARLLDEVGTIGYGWAYRVLDARYFGVPQRRRRVFIVAHRTDPQLDSRGAGERALRALWEGSSGDPTPGWPPRQITPTSIGSGPQSGRIVGALSAQGYQKYTDQEFVRQGQLVTSDDQEVVRFYPTGCSQQGFARTDGVSPTLKRGSTIGVETGTAIAFRKSKRAASDTDDESWVSDDAANTLNAFDVGDTRTTHAVIAPTLTQYNLDSRSPQSEEQQRIVGAVHEATMSVRRLTPVECERLMGWPDNWTAPPGIKAPDSKRYAACGDGIVSWVAYWIGCRIQMIEAETETLDAAA